MSHYCQIAHQIGVFDDYQQHNYYITIEIFSKSIKESIRLPSHGVSSLSSHVVKVEVVEVVG